LPVNFLSIKELHVMRFVWLADKYKLAPALVFNMDETGVRFFPVPNRTWAATGDKQVDISGVDDKRHFTAMPTLCADGTIAGRVQVIWQGKTHGSCPDRKIQSEFSDTLYRTVHKSHWSTPSTMEDAVDDLLRAASSPTAPLTALTLQRLIG
jgi:hypothetical protein